MLVFSSVRSSKLSPYLLTLLFIPFTVYSFSICKQRNSTKNALWQPEQELLIEESVKGVTYIDVDTAIRYQTIECFGGCFNELGWRALQSLPAVSADSVIKALFDTVNGCKFSMCRMPIGASDFGLDWYSLNETVNDTLMNNISIERDKRYLNQFIKAAMKYNPGLTMWGSPWSPPSWMKTNNNYPGMNGSIKQQSTILKAYALYFSKAIQLYLNDGIRFKALSFQNEPYAASNYPGCLWSAEQCRDFVKNYLGPQFESDKIEAEIWTPTMNNGDVKNFKIMLDDALSAKYIKAACFQYEGKRAVTSIHQQFPDLRLFQTETECGNATNTWEYAENPTFYYMKYYFDNGANGYFQWNMILDKSGRSTWGWAQNAMVSIDTVLKRVTYNPQYYVAKHFSYYVIPGARKVRSTGSFTDHVAFRNPDGDIVVVLNNTTTTRASVSIRIGSSIVNTHIPEKSFSTIVFYREKSNPGMIKKNRLSEVIPSRIFSSKGTLKFLQQGDSFSAQLISISGQQVGNSSTQHGKNVVITTSGIRSGLYILKRVIDGRSYCEGVILK